MKAGCVNDPCINCRELGYAIVQLWLVLDVDFAHQATVAP